MGRRPYIELGTSDPPAEELERSAERRWRPTRPGEILSPADVPAGASFGRPGPDAGWSLRLIRRAEYDRGSRPGRLESLLTSLAAARAAAAGRGPVPQDVETALSLVGLRPDGLGEEALQRLAARREEWLDAVAHEPTAGMAALADIPADLLADAPERARARLAADPGLVG